MNSKMELVLKDLALGKMIIITDDDDRENEGDLFIPAQFASPDLINFFAKEGRGLICLAAHSSLIEKFKIPMMVADHQNKSKHTTPFTVSIDAKENITTGISAYDRSHTIKLFASGTSRAEDFVMPGHIFPLAAKDGGVLERNGHTEAAVDFCRLLNLAPAGVICEILAPDGTMLRGKALLEFSRLHQLKIISIKELVAYLKNLSTSPVSTRLPTRFGEFHLGLHEGDHLTLQKGFLQGKENVLVRIHSECLTGDLFHSLKCDCGEQLEKAMEEIEEAGEGLIIYLRQEGRGIGLKNKILAYELQAKGLDTIEANLKLGFAPDLRDYSFAAQIINQLQIKSIQLMTNNPLKIEAMEKSLIPTTRKSLRVKPNRENSFYFETKKDKMNHLI